MDFKEETIMYQTVRYEKNGKIGVLTISRPAALNALNSLELTEINAAIAEVEADASSSPVTARPSWPAPTSAR